MKSKNDLRSAIEKILKIKEVLKIISPGGGTGFPEKITGIAEIIKQFKDPKTGEVRSFRYKDKISLKVDIVIKKENDNEALKAKITKIMGDIPYRIVYKI